jgi:leader peptidase (prepilin peptidase) / N-methyltransferase
MVVFAEWWMYLPLIVWLFWVFCLGACAGSFIGQAVFRLPYEKSVFWPTKSFCFSCWKPIRIWHNIPIISYLLLRGRCGQCGVKYSSKYVWVEIFTACIFVAIYCLAILTWSRGGPDYIKPWFKMPGLVYPFLDIQNPSPPLKTWYLWASYCFLACLLITASIIDAEHRIIPTTITYTGTIAGIILSVLMPWPWPSEPHQMIELTNPPNWTMPQYQGNILEGLQLWPAFGPPPEWAPAGSWRLGLLNSLIGAAVGMAVGRSLKFTYEWARGIEALGLGDADLLMMIGAFLGWQVALLALPFGAIISLLFVVPRGLYQWIFRKPFDPALPFGPGIAIAAGLIWVCWPVLNEYVRMSFDTVTTLIAVGVTGIGIVACALILRSLGDKPQ